jgi:hypothetical protein
VSRLLQYMNAFRPTSIRIHAPCQVRDDEDAMDGDEFRSLSRQLNGVFSSSGKIELLRQAASVFAVDGAQVKPFTRMYLMNDVTRLEPCLLT